MSASSVALVDALGWALIHSTWQVSVLAAGLWLLLRIMDRYPAVVRYRLCVAGLFSAPVLFVCTMLLCWDTPAVEFSALEVFATVQPPTERLTPTSLVSRVPAMSSVFLMPWLVSL